MYVFLFFLLLGGLVYSNSFHASFHFDDFPNILENPFIKDFSNFRDLRPSRYVGLLTFALNYHFGKGEVFGYHAVNFCIHVANAFLVYHWIRLIFLTPRLRDFPRERVFPVALAAAALFLVHPIQTQAVTYIVQRFASLMTLFYLLALVGYLKWRLSEGEGRRKTGWYLVALFFTLLAMKTKENAFTILGTFPLLECVFFGFPGKRRLAKLIPFFLCLAVIPLSLWAGKLKEGEFGYRDVLHISVTDYLFTQFPVVLTYLRILFWPAGLNLDYDYPVYRSFLEPRVWISFLAIAGMIGWAASALFAKRRNLFAFGLLWFFWTLSVESSFVPVGDVIFEHRLYLPSVGFFFGLAALLFQSAKTPASLRRRFCAMGAAVLALSFAAHERNKVWKNELTLWEDAAAKSPGKARTRLNLGVAYDRAGRLDEALREYDAALKLDPNNVETYNNLGVIFGRQGRLQEAMEQFEKALRLQPDHFGTHFNLGLAYKNLGMREKAIAQMERVLQIKPDFDLARETLESLKFSDGAN